MHLNPTDPSERDSWKYQDSANMGEYCISNMASSQAAKPEKYTF